MAHPELVAPQAPPVPPVPATTYRELYSDAANSPTMERTAGYLAGYRFVDGGGGAVPTPAGLRDQTVSLSDRQPMAFLVLHFGHDGTPEVAILHRLLRYVDTPGDEPSGYHDRVLGLLGDILPHQYPVVDVPGTTFHLVNTAVRIPSIAAMDALLPTWGDPQIALGPYTEEDPETEVVRPRHVQLLPGRYAALLIHRRRIKAKQAYQELMGAIRADNAVAECHDILVWLRAACTARGGGGAQNALPGVLHPFIPLYLPREVHQYVATKVEHDLPALGAAAATGAGATTATLLGALRALSERRPAEEQEPEGGIRGGGREQKSIVDSYKETYKTLLRFGNVTRPEDVAPVWTRLANCGKGEQHTVLSQEFQKVCMARGLSPELYNPVITATLKQMVVGFHFEGHGADDLASGCQPFLVAYSGSASHYQAVAAASVSNQLSQGEQSASLSDYRAIRDNEKIKFPRDVMELSITLHRYAVLCQGLFQGIGPPHPFVEAMWGLASSLQNIAPFVAERFFALRGAPHIGNNYFARVLRAVQLSAHEYMQLVGANAADELAGVPVPTYTALLQDLKRGTFHQSSNWVAIPEEYLGALPPSIGDSAGTMSIPGGAATVASSTATARTSVSSVTASEGSISSPRAPVAREANPTPDIGFTAIPMRPGGMRTVLRAHRPPTNDAGNEFCVAWWTRSACFANCGRRSTHVPFANAAERTRLLAYVREHLAAPATSAAAT